MHECIHLKTFGKPGSWSGVEHDVGGRAMLVITLPIIKMSLQVCNSPSWSKPHFPTFQRYSGSYGVLLLEDSLTVLGGASDSSDEDHLAQRLACNFTGFFYTPLLFFLVLVMCLDRLLHGL